jgi:hypothetical protein
MLTFDVMAPAVFMQLYIIGLAYNLRKGDTIKVSVV